MMIASITADNLKSDQQLAYPRRDCEQEIKSSGEYKHQYSRATGLCIDRIESRVGYFRYFRNMDTLDTPY